MKRTPLRAKRVDHRDEPGYQNDCWQGTGPDAAWLCRSCSYADTCIWRRGGI